MYKQLPAFVISTHALREEGDLQRYAAGDTSVMRFLPTPSVRRATELHKTFVHVDVNFYPRPP